MPEYSKKIKEIAKDLSSGKIDNAFSLRKDFLSNKNDLALMEVDQVVHQSMISALKDGDVDKVKNIIKVFSLNTEVIDEAIEQAIMSSFFDGNIKIIKEIKNKLPISSHIEKKLIKYCESWGDENKCRIMQEVFA